jgi:hypothetical protein
MKEFVKEIKYDLKKSLVLIFSIKFLFLPSDVSICGSTSNHDEDDDRALQRPT